MVPDRPAAPFFPVFRFSLRSTPPHHVPRNEEDREAGDDMDILLCRSLDMRTG